MKVDLIDIEECIDLIRVSRISYPVPHAYTFHISVICAQQNCDYLALARMFVIMLFSLRCMQPAFCVQYFMPQLKCFITLRFESITSLIHKVKSVRSNFYLVVFQNSTQKMHGFLYKGVALNAAIVDQTSAIVPFRAR